MIQQLNSSVTGAVDITYENKAADAHFVYAWISLDGAPAATDTVEVTYLNAETGAKLEIISKTLTAQETDILLQPSALFAMTGGDKIQLTFNNSTSQIGFAGILIRDRI